ncbi:MAG TPA: SDR family oxidoreductase [Gaiellaceae bacterium]|jgi:3-oxoacyl-[acyl-carrier protein] reductase
MNALVTGVSRRVGIGFAIAERLRADGATVFTHGWTPHDAAQEWGADDLEPDIEADFAEPDAPARVVAAARKKLGPLDTLVVNHARSGDGRLADLTAEHIDAFLHENVRAPLLLVKEFAQRFEGDRGAVVLLTSGGHLEPMPTEVAYAVSKGALAIAVTTLAEELSDRGIRVNVVNPGPTDTGWGLADADPARRMPFGRWGEPEDAARLIAWLASDDGRWVSGQVIDSEGGFRRW